MQKVSIHNINIGNRYFREYPTLIRTRKIITSFLLLFIGGMIYLAYREENLIMFKWTNYLGLTPTVEYLRQIQKHFSVYDWVKYSLPDGLWIFSFMYLTDAIWNGDKHKVAYIFIYGLPIIAVLSELMQYFTLIPGVFDIKDLLSYIFAIVLFIILKII